MQRLLVVAGALLLLAGLFWPWISQWGLGRLPGDIVLERPHVRIYFPIVTCLLISVVVTLLIWLFRK